MIPQLAQYAWSLRGIVAEACLAGAIVCFALVVAELRGIFAAARAERDAEATEHGEAE